MRGCHFKLLPIGLRSVVVGKGSNGVMRELPNRGGDGGEEVLRREGFSCYLVLVEVKEPAFYASSTHTWCHLLLIHLEIEESLPLVSQVKMRFVLKMSSSKSGRPSTFR